MSGEAQERPQARDEGNPERRDLISRPNRIFARFVIATSLAALGFAVLSGLGHRWEWWSFKTGFLVLKWAAYAAILSFILSGMRMIATRPGRGRLGFYRNLFTLVLSAAVIGIPAQALYRARQVPRIHDITSDTADPPSFEALLPTRQAAPNGAAYGGLEIAIQQQTAYPDIDTILLAEAPAVAFEKALSVANSLKWEIVAAEPEALRIEATDTTWWFGFKDDVVIRIRPMDTGSRLDIRSASRVGRSDVGANATRIRRFFKALGKD